MKVLVTGAAGNIGSEFVRLQGHKYELRLLDLQEPEETHLREAGSWITGNLAEMPLAKQAVEGIETVVHLAANPSGEASFEQLLPDNIISTYNVFEASSQAGVRRVIFASTIQTVYGYPEDVTATPDMPPRPVNLYGASKAWGEALCSVYSRQGLQCAAIRIGAFTDPGDADKLTDSKMLTNFVGKDDLTQLIALIVDFPREFKFEVFHGLSDNAVKRLSISKEEHMLGYEPRHAALPPEGRKGGAS